MRVLFSSVPTSGHLLPMLPLVRAVRRQRHEVALLSGRGAKEIVPRLDVFEVGPSVVEAMAETTKRLPGDDGTDPGAGTVELFGAVRIDTVADELIKVAGEFRPDLVVHETMDMTGPLVAAALGVPHVEHRVAGPLPAELLKAMGERGHAEYERRGLVRSSPIAVVDPYPELLLGPDQRHHGPEWMAIRPEPHVVEGCGPLSLPRVTGPVAALTLGTTVDDSAALSAMAVSIAEAGVTALVTVEPDALEVPDQLGDRIHAVGFAPLAQLLPAVDVVVSAGGTGTVLAALTVGKPLVIRPFFADQPWNAQRVAEHRAGIAIEQPAEAGAAVRHIVEDGTYRAAAERIAEGIAELADADQVLDRIISRMPVS